jgi:hypothetical protein
MLSLVWAFGATLILFLILTLLRIGFSFKGKLIVALTGFVLALAGQAAVTSFPLWQTGLIVLLLVLAAAYVMDSRLAAVIYEQGTDSFELESDEEFEEQAVFDQIEEKQVELEMLDLDTVGDELVPLMNKEDPKEPDLEELLQDQLGLENSLQEPIDLLLETDDLPIVVKSVREETIEEEGYLADIESLLLEETEKSSHFEDDDLLEEIDDLELFVDEKVEAEKDENLLEDLLRAAEEAAAATEKANVEPDKEREVKLQK